MRGGLKLEAGDFQGAYADAKKALEPLVRVRVGESEDREVHVRHRVQFRGYPLAVVLDHEPHPAVAVERGADLAYVEKLMDLKERMDKADAKRLYDDAFAKFSFKEMHNKFIERFGWNWPF